MALAAMSDSRLKDGTFNSQFHAGSTEARVAFDCKKARVVMGFCGGLKETQ